MDTVLLIISIVISAIALVVCAVLLVIVIKRGKATNGGENNSEAIAALQANLQSIHNDVVAIQGNLTSLKDSIPLVVSGEITKQMLEIQKQLTQQTDQSANRLAEFQKRIQETVATQAAQTKTSLDQAIAAINKEVADNFTKINDHVNQSLQDGFKANSDTMGELKTQLGAIDNAQKRLGEVNNQIVSLNNILMGNQTRGAYGELQLAMLLEATFPNGKGKYYNLQDDLGHVKDGEKVRPDADIVFVSGEVTRKLCIDSKFPFADYNRLFSGENMEAAEKEALKTSFKAEVKKKYISIADKYLIPDLTVPYAVMFIPNDGVFAFIENNYPDLVSEARANKVILACPSTLQAIIVVFSNAVTESERNKNLEAISSALAKLNIQFKNLADRWVSLQKTIDATVNKTHEFNTTVDKIGKAFDGINTNNLGIEETPKAEEPKVIEPAPDDESDR
jgi:DNA recombination protein RmuC